MISSGVREFPILFSFLFVALLALWGGFGGYYFYEKRDLLSSTFFGIGLLQIILILWLI